MASPSVGNAEEPEGFVVADVSTGVGVCAMPHGFKPVGTGAGVKTGVCDTGVELADDDEISSVCKLVLIGAGDDVLEVVALVVLVGGTVVFLKNGLILVLLVCLKPCC